MYADRYYDAISLDIFEDELKTKLKLVQVVVEQFQKTFEDASFDKDIRKAFKIEKVLLKLDSRLVLTLYKFLDILNLLCRCIGMFL